MSSKNKVRAVLFDLDDTLCNSRPAFDAGLRAAFQTLLTQRPDLNIARLYDIWQDAHKHLFAELDAGRINMAQVREERFSRVLRAFGIEDEGLSAELNLTLGHVQLQNLRLFDEADVLERLRPYHRIGIITNGANDSHPDSQRSKIAHLGLQERVDAVCISDAVGHRKPAPAIFHAAASCLDVPCEHILFVGDNPIADICGAHNVGMTTAWLHRGSTWPAEITDVHPDHVLDSLGQLAALLKI